jgi:glycosyltransferase involved in cell wall biosynthesis
MRIAVFSDTYKPQVNGVAHTLAKLKQYMDEHGIENRFYVSGSPSLSEPDVSYNGGLSFILYPELTLSLPCYLQMARELDQFKPEIIHLATPFSMGLAGLKYARSRRIPITASYHTNYPNYLKYYHVGWPPLEKMTWAWLRWFHSHASVNFCPSRSTLAELRSNGIENLAIWGRGIDTDKFSPQWRSHEVRRRFCPDESQLLLYVGRLAPEKQLDVLLNTARMLNAVNAKFKLVFVGDGPSRSLLENQGIDNVIFAGYMQGRELQELYASSDVFVFPSPSETFGNVVLEAMASGLPVVAAYAGGVMENLQPEFNGLGVRPGNPGEFFEAIRCMEDHQYRQKLADGARIWALEKKWDNIFASLFSEYQTVLNRQLRWPYSQCSSTMPGFLHRQ